MTIHEQYQAALQKLKEIVAAKDFTPAGEMAFWRAAGEVKRLYLQMCLKEARS